MSKGTIITKYNDDSWPERWTALDEKEEDDTVFSIERGDHVEPNGSKRV